MRVVAVLLGLAGIAAAQETLEVKPTPTERVERATRDYLDALYEAQAKLIERSVSRDLVKAGVVQRKGAAKPEMRAMSYEQLHKLAGRWNAKKDRVKPDSPRKVEVLAVGDRIAATKVTAQWGVDFMQLERRKDGSWQIAHVLWQRHGDPSKETKAIERAGLDYIDAFYERKPELIERSVDGQVVKFGFYRPGGKKQPVRVPMNYGGLRGLAKRAFPSKPKDAPREVDVLGSHEHIACIRITAAWGVDFAHVARLDGKWKIVHVVWESHPAAPKGKPRKAKLRRADAVNETCPFSGRPIAAGSLTRFEGSVVGFCNPGCRDKFAANPKKFPAALAKLRGAAKK